MKVDGIGDVVVERLRPSPGDILFVTLKSDDVDEKIVAEVRKRLRAILPDGVRVNVFGIGASDDIELKVIRDCDAP